MGITFNIDEILQMAIKIEQNGQEFYLKAAEQASDDKVKTKFKELAGMETQHEAFFKELQSSLAQREKEETTYDPFDEGALYLKAFASGYVFNPQSNAASEISGNEPVAAILKKAIGIEKDSIVFYLGIKDMVPKDLGKDKVDKVIREEMSHIRILGQQLQEL